MSEIFSEEREEIGDWCPSLKHEYRFTIFDNLLANSDCLSSIFISV